jgi:transposase
MDGKAMLKLQGLELSLPDTVEACHEVIRYHHQTFSLLFKRVEQLEIDNRVLRERLNNNSSNSSLPPSKDYKKKKKQKPPSENKSGGQAGHKGHYREMLASDKADAIINCKLPTHCLCGGEIELREAIGRHQVYELPEIKLHVTEYQLEKGSCVKCGGHQTAALPSGITGPKLTSFMSHLISRYHLSRRELKDFLKEHFNFTVSLGTVFNKQRIVNAALREPVSELLETIKESPFVNMDETGHCRDGQKEWMWGFISATAAFFSVAASRGKSL